MSDENPCAVLPPLTLLQTLAMRAAECYVDGNEPTWHNDTKTSQVYVSVEQDHGVVIYALPGTETISDWLSNLDVLQVSVIDHPRLGRVHEGFLPLALEACEFVLNDMARRGWPSFALTGHSKGAAVVTLLHALLKDNTRQSVLTLALEPPRCGTDALACFVAGDAITRTYTANATFPRDLITLLPTGFGYTDVGAEIRLVVPDSLGAEAVHKMPSVLAALGCPPVQGI